MWMHLFDLLLCEHSVLSAKRGLFHCLSMEIWPKRLSIGWEIVPFWCEKMLLEWLMDGLITVVSCYTTNEQSLWSQVRSGIVWSEIAWNRSDDEADIRRKWGTSWRWPEDSTSSWLLFKCIPFHYSYLRTFNLHLLLLGCYSNYNSVAV